MSALPSGTVTFLFTDVQGSTRLMERHPQAYRTALARHHVILRSAVEDHAGSVFETVGDAVYAAFASASDALEAALEAQRALANEAWGELGMLKVRMGLHTGEVELHGEHYFGAPLYRCARLSSAGHGGQVLLSSITAELVRESLPARAGLRDLGEHRLKDLQRAERVFQLTAPGMTGSFPPLRTLGAVPNNLPVEPTAFVGREQEVQAARARLMRPETRLLTLTGPGGVGKTRLALQIAADVVHEFSDGVFAVSLAPVASADRVPATIAKVFAIPEIEGRPTTDALTDHLAPKHLLLILDNFEHVLAAAPFVSELLAACPLLKIVVTSREGLQLRGEHQFSVPPLAMPEAIRLFVERAETVKSTFTVSVSAADAIAAICRRLDGLPLAIELAAARVNLFSPQAILARLEHRLAVLTGGPRDLPARQQTLRQAIAWSFDLLHPGEQAMYRRLGVFVGGCRLAAAEAVLGSNASSGDLVDGFASLVNKSLVRQAEDSDGEPRFQMLETIREYALDRLAEASEIAEYRRRHADHFLAYVEHAEPDLSGIRQADCLARLEPDHDNVRAAIGWLAECGAIEQGLRLAAALRRFWRARGFLSEGREWLKSLLAHPAAPARGKVRAKALHAAGWLAREQGDYGEARVLYEESLALYRELDDLGGVGWALIDLGFLMRYRGDFAAARTALDESLPLVAGVGDREGVAAALGNLGLIARDRGDTEEADARLSESLRIWSEIGDRVGFGWAMTALGLVARVQRKPGVARERLEAALGVWRELGDRQNMANVLGTLAALARENQDCNGARTRLDESLMIFRDIGDRRGIAFALEGFAGLAAIENDGARAAFLAAAADQLRKSIGAPAPPSWRADLEESLARVRPTLSDAQLSEAEAHGRAMPLHEVVAFAVQRRT